MALLAPAIRSVQTGTAYAVGTGLGAVGGAIMGTALLGERWSAVQVVFIALIILGVIGTNLFATASMIDSFQLRHPIWRTAALSALALRPDLCGCSSTAASDC